MADAKLSVTIELQGSTIITSQECEENPDPLKNFDRNFMVLSTRCYDKKTKKFCNKKEPLVFYTSKCIPAHQVIKMSNEAYESMISTTCPEWFMPQGGINKWKRLTPEQRLEAHLDRTCKSLKGKSYSYVIFGD